jgi:hypothetical protein
MQNLARIGLLSAILTLLTMPTIVASMQGYMLPTQVTVTVYQLDPNTGAIQQPPTLCSSGDLHFGCTAFHQGLPPADQRPYPYDSTNPVTAPIETDYLLDVVPQEMSSSYSHAALQTQAIAARTFVYWHINQGHTINNSISYQAFIPLKFQSLNSSTFVGDIATICQDSDLNGNQQAVCEAVGPVRYLTVSGAVTPIDAEYRAENGDPTNPCPDDLGDCPPEGENCPGLLQPGFYPDQYPYLKGVADPISAGASRSQADCNSVGMSQQGAQRWAQGIAYSGDPWSVRWDRADQILVHYYTGVHLRDSDTNRLTPAYRWVPLSVDWHTPDNHVPSPMYYTQTYTVTFWVQNVGTTTWYDPDQVYLSYHGWPGGARAQGDRSSFPVAPGETMTDTVTLYLSETIPPGTPQRLRFDMLLESDGWFSELESERPWPTYDATVCVNGPCRVFLPMVMRNWTSIFLFDTFNPMNPNWEIYTSDPGGNASDYVHVYTADGHDDSYSLFITEQVGHYSYTSGARITLTVPSGVSPLTLSYWYRRVDSRYGYFRVKVDGQVVQSGTGSTSWQQRTLDISGYATDGEVTLTFEVPKKAGYRHALIFDEITVSTQ